MNDLLFTYALYPTKQAFFGIFFPWVTHVVSSFPVSAKYFQLVITVTKEAGGSPGMWVPIYQIIQHQIPDLIFTLLQITLFRTRCAIS
jgi:hypothetical protein